MSPNCTDMQAPAGHQYPQAFTEGATVLNDARTDAERIFREVFSACLSGNALEQRIRARLRIWDAEFGCTVNESVRAV